MLLCGSAALPDVLLPLFAYMHASFLGMLMDASQCAMLLQWCLQEGDARGEGGPRAHRERQPHVQPVRTGCAWNLCLKPGAALGLTRLPKQQHSPAGELSATLGFPASWLHF